MRVALARYGEGGYPPYRSLARPPPTFLSHPLGVLSWRWLLVCVCVISHDREEPSACVQWTGAMHDVAMHDVEWRVTRAMQHDANRTRERELAGWLAIALSSHRRCFPNQYLLWEVILFPREESDQRRVGCARTSRARCARRGQDSSRCK